MHNRNFDFANDSINSRSKDDHGSYLDSRAGSQRGSKMVDYKNDPAQFNKLLQRINKQQVSLNTKVASGGNLLTHQ